MDNNMREIDQETPKAPTEARSRSLLAQTVETQLLPEDRFKDLEGGEITFLEKVGGNIACIKKNGRSYEGLIRDKVGRLSKFPLDFSSHKLARDVKTHSESYIPMTRTSNTAGRVRRYLDSQKIDPNLTQILQDGWFQEARSGFPSSSNEDLTADNVLEKPEVFLPSGPWDIKTVSTPDGDDMIIFSNRKVNVGFILGNHPRVSNIVDTSLSSMNPLHNEKLPGDMVLEKGASVFSFKDKNGMELASFSGHDPIIDPIHPNTLYFINTGRIYSLDINGISDRSSRPTLEAQIELKDSQEIEIDPNGNFFIVRASDNKLHIIDKETGDDIRVFDDVKGPTVVSEQGDILFVDTQGKLREVQTNFQAIPAGGSEVAQKKRQEELRQMQERFANLELKKVERQRGGQISEADVAKTLRETISRQVTEQITNAANPSDVEDVLDRLQGLKGDPANQAYGEVIDEFVGQARDKLSGIRTSEFDSQLSVYQKALDEVKSVGDTIGLDEQFAKLLELRQKIDITDPQKRREIEQRLRTLQSSKDALNNQFQGELVNAARETLPEIEQLVKETGSTQELGYLSTSTQAQQFEMMLANIRDPEVRRELRDKYNALRSEQRTRLEESNRQLVEQDRQRWAQVVQEAREDLGSLQEQIEQLSDDRELNRFERNPLVIAWRAKLFALPPELRVIEEKRLEIILGARKKDMEHRKELGAVGEAGELRFGSATFPVYKEPPRIWQAKLSQRKTGFSTLADLTFEDMQGRSWRPDGENDVVVNNDLSDERTKNTIEHYRREADEYFRGIKRKVPDFDEHWKITEFHMGKLEEIAEALNLQIVNHRGILILQGEAGTGKNVLVDMLANLSNREVIQIACNENTVKEDLTYEFYFDEKGTYKLPSRLVEGIQTPGTIILLDEINALKPGIAKMMNSLFDYRRRIYLPEGGKEREIITDPTVLFVATMNPQNYGGVKPLSPEVKSRSRVVDIDYAPFEEMRGGRTRYRSDEAEMLAGYMEKLGELKQNELKLVWDHVINRDTTNGADRILQGDPTIEQDIRRIYDVIRVANRLRDMYAAYQTGDSNEPMDFPTSLREVTDIVMEMNHRQGVKPIIKRVIIPKIDDRRQKKLVEQTIDAVLPD